MPEYLADPVGRLLELHAKAAERTVVALAGFPGSGKTTLTRKWEKRVNSVLGPSSFFVTGMDGFHLTKRTLLGMDNAEEALARRGAPWTFNPLGFLSKLTELKESYGRRSVGWPGFDHSVGDPAEDAIVIPQDCRLILVEGIYTLLRTGEWAGLNGMFNETWFLDTPLETAMRRLYVRHREAWGMTEEEARAQADGNDRLNSEYVAPGKRSADYLVAG